MLADRLLNEIPGVSSVKPQGALYCFPRLDPEVYPIEDDEVFVIELLRAKKILVTHGTGFNWPEPGPLPAGHPPGRRGARGGDRPDRRLPRHPPLSRPPHHPETPRSTPAPRSPPCATSPTHPSSSPPRPRFRLLGQNFQMSGTEHVPRSGGVLLAVNHIGYVDFVYGGLAANPSGRKVRFMAKRELFDHKYTGPLMRSLHHIEVDRGDGLASYTTAVEYLRAGEAVGIFPEATISRAMELKEFKSGAVRIAAEAGVPLVPVILWGTQRMMTKDHPRDFSRGKTIAIRVGPPLHPTGEDPVAETAELHRGDVARCSTRRSAPTPLTEQPPGVLVAACQPRRQRAHPGGGGASRRGREA